MRIACISDTHNELSKVVYPDAKVLVHTGDLTRTGQEKQVKRELKKLNEAPYEYILFTPGNHDHFFDPNAPRRFRSWSLFRYYGVKEMMAKFPNIILLLDSSVVIDGVKFYGSPWTPYFNHDPDEPNPWAFNFAPNLYGDKGYMQAANTWAKIPDDVNVLMTHGPPQGILDYAKDARAGCPMLRKRVEQLEDLHLHAFGHLHRGYGHDKFIAGDGVELHFVNASINNIHYQPINAPIVIDI